MGMKKLWWLTQLWTTSLGNASSMGLTKILSILNSRSNILQNIPCNNFYSSKVSEGENVDYRHSVTGVTALMVAASR